MLRKGEAVNINPYDYGDFLRYVKGLGLEDEFAAMENSERFIGDPAYPIVVDMKLTAQ